MMRLLLLLLTLGATERPVSLAYDYETSDMSAFRLYGARANRGFAVQVVPGPWVFRATAVDADGNESDYSNECRWGKRTGFRVRTN